MRKKDPDPSLYFDPALMRLQEFPRSFYLRKTEAVAKALLGQWLARRYLDRWYGCRIVETEAYLGSKDPAAHSWRGRRTERVQPMYMEGGHLYVFFVYGMHSCANVVTGPEGIAEAVLLRAGEGPPGAPARLLSGPGRLCAALGITVGQSGMDLLGGNDLRILGRARDRNLQIGISPRIGIDYAGEAKHWPLRFFDINSPAVSGPARLRLKKSDES